MFPQDLAYSAAQIRQLEQLALERQQLDSATLMQRAGTLAWQHIVRDLPVAQRFAAQGTDESNAKSMLVLCGPGNNGGDGFVVARLALEAGWQVAVLFDARWSDKQSAEAGAQRQAYTAAGGRLLALNGAWPEALDVIVDAMLGIGLNRAPGEPIAGWIKTANQSPARRYALDISTGLQADSGSALEPVFAAHQSLCFLAWKSGQLQAPALEYNGQRIAIDLGLDAEIYQTLKPEFTAIAANNVQWPAARRIDSHKYQHGEIGVIGGAPDMAGAVRLCAEAALRSGAGIVRVLCAAESQAAVINGRPEILLGGLPFAEERSHQRVLALGPGLGNGGFIGKALIWALQSNCPKVVDADALNIDWLKHADLSRAVLTPHSGEAARLLQISSAEVQADRPAALQALVKKYHCVVVLKGASTLVAAPQQPQRLLLGADSGMASAGMGDVLSGIIAALMGQGLSAFEAACCGVFWHAQAAQVCAHNLGSPGYLASDVIQALPNSRGRS